MKRLIIIDGNAIVHRAYHALPKLTTKKGELVNAIYGFLLFFVKAINEFKPDYIIAAFDYPAPTFRKEKYKEYKANREKAPDELYLQIPKIKNLLEKFGIKVLEKKGFEADDIIGTVAKGVLKEKDIETIILTGDMDALQLVGDRIKVYALKRGIKDAILFGEKEVIEKYDGLLPNQLVDYKALRGDPSDNIPGVFGIGEKTATELIKKFNSVDELYGKLDGIAIKDSLKEKLVKNKEKAFLSKMLARILLDVPMEFSLTECEWKGYNEVGFRELEDYGFKTLIQRIYGKKEELPRIKIKENNNLKLF
jgi:DNA polymerase I